MNDNHYGVKQEVVTTIMMEVILKFRQKIDQILRTLGSLIGVSGGKALFQFLPSWDQFPTAALSSEVLINRYCHHTASCVDQVLGQRTVESIRAFLDCFPPPTSQCMCSKVSDSNNINMAKKQNINSTKKTSSQSQLQCKRNNNNNNSN